MEEDKGSTLNDEKKAKVYKLDLEIGEGATISRELRELIERVTLSDTTFSEAEKEFIKDILSHKDLGILEDWKILVFKETLIKANVKIKLKGKPQLNVKASAESSVMLIRKLRECYIQEKNAKLRHVLEDEEFSSDISDAYVNLALVEGQKTLLQTGGEDNNPPPKIAFQDTRVMNSHEQIYGKKTEFSVAELLSPLKNGERRKKVTIHRIRGRAGIGKSTLAMEYSKRALKGPLKHLDFTVNRPAPEITTEKKALENNENEQWINLFAETPSMILIEGWAGIGKTVLCQHLANTWAINTQDKDKKWWTEDVELVVWIRLRNLATYDSENCRLGEVIRRECFGVHDSGNPNYLSAAQIEADLEAMGDKVILLLDGFDEVADWYNEVEPGKKQILTGRSHLLQNLLINNRFNHRVLLTSRPNRVAMIASKFDRRLEMIGFKDENIEKYVQKFFASNPIQGKKLLDNMNSNQNLWGIGHIPVNLALICIVWKDKDIDGVIPNTTTMTELYKDVIEWLLRRDWVKHPVESLEDQHAHQQRMSELGIKTDSVAEDAEELQRRAREITLEKFEHELPNYPMKLALLEELAWFAQTENNHNLLIHGSQVSKYLSKHYKKELFNYQQRDIVKALQMLGLLESQFNSNNVKVKENQFYFTHLTFQEYFAAKHWVRMFCSEQVEERIEAKQLLKQYKYHPQFEVVWWFTAGLLRNKLPIRLEKFFKIMQEEHRDLLGMYHNILLMRCLEESNFQLENDANLINMINVIAQLIQSTIANYQYSYHNKVYLIAETYKSYLNNYQRCPTLLAHDRIMTMLLKNINVSSVDREIVIKTLQFIVDIRIIDSKLLEAVLKLKDNPDSMIRRSVLSVLSHLKLLNLSRDQQQRIIISVIDAFNDKDQDVLKVVLDVFEKWAIVDFSDDCQRLCMQRVVNALKKVDGNNRVLMAEVFAKIISQDLSENLKLPYFDSVLALLQIVEGNGCKIAVYVFEKLNFEILPKNFQGKCIRAVHEAISNSDDVNIRCCAIWIFRNWARDSQIPRYPEEFLRIVLAALKDQDARVREIAAYTLQDSHISDLPTLLQRDCMEAVIKSLEDSSKKIQEIALITFSRWRLLEIDYDTQRKCIEGLVERIQSEDYAIREATMQTLRNWDISNLAPDLQQLCVDSVIEAIKNTNNLFRYPVDVLYNWDITKFSPDLQEKCVKNVLAELKNSDNSSQNDNNHFVLRVLSNWRIGDLILNLPADCVHGVQNALRFSDKKTQGAALGTLGEWKAQNRLSSDILQECILCLLKACDDPDKDIRLSAINALVISLEKLSSDSRQLCLQGMYKALRDTELEVRSFAVMGLMINMEKLSSDIRESCILEILDAFAENQHIIDDVPHILGDTYLTFPDLSQSLQERCIQLILSSLKLPHLKLNRGGMGCIAKLTHKIDSLELIDFLTTSMDPSTTDLTTWELGEILADLSEQRLIEALVKEIDANIGLYKLFISFCILNRRIIFKDSTSQRVCFVLSTGESYTIKNVELFGFINSSAYNDLCQKYGLFNVNYANVWGEVSSPSLSSSRNRFLLTTEEKKPTTAKNDSICILC